MKNILERSEHRSRKTDTKIENSGRNDWASFEQHWDWRPWICSGTNQPYSNAFRHWLHLVQEEADGRTESASGSLPGSRKDTMKQKLIRRPDLLKISDIHTRTHTHRAMPPKPYHLILSPILFPLDNDYQFGHDQESDLAPKMFHGRLPS